MVEEPPKSRENTPVRRPTAERDIRPTEDRECLGSGASFTTISLLSPLPCIRDLLSLQPDRRLVDLGGELIVLASLFVVVRDRCGVVHGHVGSFIGRKEVSFRKVDKSS